MEKLDLTKKYKSYYTATSKPQEVEIEAANFLSIAGHGDPSGEEFAQRTAVLYAIAYAVKFDFKQRDMDFVVPKLEGLWWFDEERYSGILMADAPVKIPRREWSYRLMIRLPEYAQEGVFSKIKSEVIAKKKLNYVDEVEWHAMNEGTCIQVLHVGPFEREPESLQKLNDFMEEQGWKKNGHHHEIYLSDFRKTVPEKLRTILREPVRK